MRSNYEGPALLTGLLANAFEQRWQRDPCRHQLGRG
jgi:hypothetical protein